ncbi:hypothetical protein I6E29_09245 [Arcanobacterium haemolyticum]|nr:hypothetical protein [Arcanobacterium haemolyticum]
MVNDETQAPPSRHSFSTRSLAVVGAVIAAVVVAVLIAVFILPNHPIATHEGTRATPPTTEDASSENAHSTPETLNSQSAPDTFQSGTFVVPVECISAISPSQVGEPITFVDGVYNGEAPYSMITIADSISTTFGPATFTTANFRCNPGGSIDYDFIGVYTPKNELVMTFGPWDENYGSRFDGFIPRPYFENLRVENNQLVVDMPRVGIYGDDACNGCQLSGSITTAFAPTGTGFEVADIVYHTPNGDVRVPKVADVQEAMDALHTELLAGHGDQMMPFLDSLSALDELKMPTFSGNPRSSVYLPATVEACSLMPADGNDNDILYFRNKMKGYNGFKGAEPGDILCGFNPPDTTTNYDNTYTYYIGLRGTPDGSVKIKNVWGNVQ